MYFWRYLRIAQLSIFYFIGDYLPIYKDLEIKNSIKMLSEVNYQNIHKDTVFKLDDFWSGWFHWPFGLCFIYLGFRRIGRTDKIDNIYDVDSLLAFYQKINPNLGDVLSEDVINKPLIYNRDDDDTHYYSSPIDPLYFATISPPLGLEEAAKKNKAFLRPIWDKKEDFDTDLCERSFITFLGEGFEGKDKLQEHELKLYEVLYNFINLNSAKFEAITINAIKSILDFKDHPSLDELELYSTEPALIDYLKQAINTEKVSLNKLMRKKKSNEGITKKHFISPKFLKKLSACRTYDDLLKDVVCERKMSVHFYKSGGFCALFDYAKSSGVITTDKFRFVKRHDRNLWQSLCSVHRKTPLVEASATFSHMGQEIELGQPLSHPEVLEAVEGLRIEMMEKDD
ncbi:hypothetical protein AB6D11_03140 [Vibrio splendidus]